MLEKNKFLQKITTNKLKFANIVYFIKKILK